MKTNANNSYQNSHYKQWLTLPPQIPIPYNQSFLHVLSLKIHNLDYLNTFMPSHKKSTPQNDNQSPIDQNSNKFRFKTYWWGQQSGYQSLLKTLQLDQNGISSSEKKSKQNQIFIKSNNDPKNQLIFEPIKFLVCCPLDNFLKYCFDMRILKIQLLSVQLNTVIAKSYINFLTLNNCWKGQPIQLNIPLFAPSFNLQSFNGVQGGKSPKIIGQIRLQMSLERIPNPYKIVPQRPSEVQRTNKKSSEDKMTKSREKFLKQNINSNETNNNAMSNFKNDQENKGVGSSSFDSQNSMSEYLVESNDPENDNLGKSHHMINYHNFEQKINNRRNRKNLQIQSKQKQGNSNLLSQNPEYNKINIPKHNYESQKMKLHEDFKLIFGIKNPLYNSFFKSNSQNNLTQVQTIEFHLKIVQLTEINDKNICFDHVNVLIPVMSSQESKSVQGQRYNEYRICQQRGIIKIQFETGSYSSQQIENFIKQAIVTLEIFYSKQTKKQVDQNKKVLNGHLQGSKQHEQVLSLKGMISLLSLLANCGVENRVNLIGDKKIGKICECFILAVSGHSQSTQHEQNDKKSENELHKKVPQEQKKAIHQARGMKEELVWLKIDKFIPLNHHYFKQSNIYVKINLIQTDKKSINQDKPQKKSTQQKQRQKVQIKQIGQTATLWKPFGQINQLIAHFKNQSITFPIYLQQGQEKDIFLCLQVWNRQKSNIKIGSGLISLKGKSQQQLRGRCQLQIKDLRKQMIGFVEIWCQRGDINYINSLIAAHVNPKQSFSQNNSQKQPNQENIIKPHENDENKKIIKEEQQSQSQYSSSNLQETSSLQSSSVQQSHQDSHQKQLKQNQNQVINKLGLRNFIKFQRRLNEWDNVLQIHNQLSFALLIALNSSQNHHTLSDLIDKFQTKSIRQSSSSEPNIFMDPNQFYSLIAYYLCSPFPNRKLQNFHLNELKKYLKTLQPSQKTWFNEICDIYSSFNKHLINFTQFQNSMQAFSTYYDQIIESKNHAFNQFKDILNSAFIQIHEIQDDMIYQLEKINPNQQPIDFIKKAKTAIFTEILKSSRVNQSVQIQIETQIQNFLSFYTERAFQLSQKFEAISLTRLICDQLRKFELYETTFETRIQPESFKSFISKNLREILEIDYYIKPDKLMDLVQQNQIQLSQWEIINLTDTYHKKTNNQNIKSQNRQKILSKDPSKQRIIVKSPTFGLLEQVNINSKDLRNDKLFKTSPVDYNPSIVGKMLKKPQNRKILQISEVGSNQEKKESENSYILKKRIEMISPISNNIDINHEISSTINPSSMFLNNYNSNQNYNSRNNYSTNNQNKNSGDHINQENQDQVLEVSHNQLSTDCLTVLFANLKRKVIWLKSGKFTYFPQQSHIDSISKLQIQKSLNQIQKSFQDNSHSLHNQKKINQESHELSHEFQRQNGQQESQNLKLQSKNRQNQSLLSPSLINLFGLQVQDYYNLQVRVIDGQKEDVQTQILVNCEHGLWEKLIDSSGKQIGSLLVCLNSQLRSDSLNISSNYVSQNH